MSALYTHAVVALRDRQISYGISFAAGIRIGIAGVLKTWDEPQLMKRKERRHELRIARIEQYGDLIAFANRQMESEAGVKTRYTFAGAEYFERMKEKGLYTTDPEEIKRRVRRYGLEGIYSERLL